MVITSHGSTPVPDRHAHRRNLLAPAVAGWLILSASFVPWLADPLYGPRSPWSVEITLAWPLSLPVLSLGQLCLAGWLLSCLHLALLWHFSSNSRGKGVWLLYRGLRLLCALPLMLFLLEYLSGGTAQMDVLMQHKIEAVLIQRHLGYNLARDWLPVTTPFALDSSSFIWRLQLLVDQLRPGVILPLLSLAVLSVRRAERDVCGMESLSASVGWLARLGRYPLSVACLLVVMGTSPILLCCEMEAGQAFAAGGYTAGLGWLDLARWLYPDLERTVLYHDQYGQALYALQSGARSDDSHFYLARRYRLHRAYLPATRELLPLWRAHPHAPWLTQELSADLEGLIETAWLSGPLSIAIVPRVERSGEMLSWLQILAEIEPGEVYAPYMLARAQYGLQNYSACIAQMEVVLQLSPTSDIRSSAYTYIGLAQIGLGHTSQGREALLMAVVLDPDYRNNTAREALSGLH